ncbi:helix-turn-helix domain-containing protein [Pseudogracilibacillus sp. SO30301A]|uniref:helix-turn-helix domain-containing protein n=1 Tax=Pseudogracilibacillus sp. SO30301A TaxID=3098291 RepID=UPI00300DC3B8
MNIGKRIKNIRLSKGMNASQLANKAFISQSYLSDIEAGRTAPSLDKLFTICEALDISLSEFFGDVPELPVDIIRLVENARQLEDEEIKLLSNFIELIVKRSK